MSCNVQTLFPSQQAAYSRPAVTGEHSDLLGQRLFTRMEPPEPGKLFQKAGAGDRKPDQEDQNFKLLFLENNNVISLSLLFYYLSVLRPQLRHLLSHDIKYGTEPDRIPPQRPPQKERNRKCAAAARAAQAPGQQGAATPPSIQFHSDTAFVKKKKDEQKERRLLSIHPYTLTQRHRPRVCFQKQR